MKNGWMSVFVAGALLVSTQAFAHTFDDMCAPLTEHTPGFDNPNVMLVVDKSGSMKTEMSPGWSRWRTATAVIGEVTTDLERPGPCPTPNDASCDPVRWGLGFFSSSARLELEPAEDTSAEIRRILGDTVPSGETQTHTGANLLVSSVRLRDGDRPQVGVIVTDGAPDLANTARQAVRHICTARTRASGPVTTYTVGFGPGSNQAVNGFMAAAGGTGQCCEGAAYPCGAAEEVDPCDMSATELANAILDTGADDSTYINSRYSCGGSLEASNGRAFKAALLDITEEAACTFDLDIPADYPEPSASTDPDATWVEMGHVLYGDVRLPFCAPGDTDCGLAGTLQALGIPTSEASGYASEGWYFADTARTKVRLSSRLCGEVQSRRVEKVRTQVACVCRLTGEACTVTIDGFTNEQLQNMRCGAGVYECVQGVDVCTSLYGPMPEICNGIDDDCNGNTDDMSDSWDRPEFQSAAYDLPADRAGIDCQQLDVCVCPAGTSDQVSGTDAASFFDSWSGACTCGEGLADGPMSTMDQPTTELDDGFAEDNQAACSAAGTRGAGGSLLLLLVGAAMMRRRRRD